MNEEKEAKNYIKKIICHIKQNKRFYMWLFIFLILPLLVECGIYFIEKGLKIAPIQAFKKMFYILRDYKSYYATILTLSFAIFSYNKQQEKLLEEKQKENELREKELEDKKDYYRPIFVIKKDKYDHSKKQVKLLMKNKELYLQKIRVFKIEVLDEMKEYIYPPTSATNIFYGTSKIDIICEKKGMKSGEIIVEDRSDKLFIVAETLIGETILFGYIYDNNFYKYLKENKDPCIPNDSKELYNQELINNVWGNFNTKIEIMDNTLDLLFFGYSWGIRQVIKDKHFEKFEDSLKAETLSDFLENIFFDIKSVVPYEVSQKSIYKVLKNYIMLLKYVSSFLFVDSEDEEKFNRLVYNIPEDIKSKNKLFKNLSTDILEFLNVINDYIDYCNENFPEDFMQFFEVLDLLGKAFNIIKVNDEYNNDNEIQSNFVWKKLILDIKFK